jgi:hypothetical protein
MRALRLAAMALIASVIALGVVAEQGERSVPEAATVGGLGQPDATIGAWFCPGGSGPGGRAAVALELINAGTEPSVADIVTVRSDTEPGRRSQVSVGPGERVGVAIAEFAVDAAWIGAIVEIAGSDVIVEQTYDGLTGIDRAPCTTRTSQQLFATDGATRVIAEGEEMLLLLLNPFQEDAVVDIAFDADVGIDRLTAVVVPARRLAIIDVTQEVTVASRVSARIEALSGRVVGSRIQTRTGTARGLTVTPLVQDGAAASVIPSVRTELGLTDRVLVTNPGDESAEVDLEILTDGSNEPDPVELTIRPGRTAEVVVSAESRLAAISEFAILARSLTGDPVAVGIERLAAIDPEFVPGTAAMPAIDGAAERWIAPLDGTSTELVLVNPSTTAIARVDVYVVRPDGRSLVTTIELGPGRRATVSGDLLGERPIVVVEASSAIVVGREIVGLTSRQMMAAVAASELTPIAQLP